MCILSPLQPVDCLSLAAMEMEESPEVAIIQHASGVMNVTHSFFENASKYHSTNIQRALFPSLATNI